VSVSESGTTRLAGEPAFFTVGTSTSNDRVAYQYSLTLMKGKRMFRFTLVSLAGDPRKNPSATRLLNSASIQ